MGLGHKSLLPVVLATPARRQALATLVLCTGSAFQVPSAATKCNDRKLSQFAVGI